jgi:hypothetical protein
MTLITLIKTNSLLFICVISVDLCHQRLSAVGFAFRFRAIPRDYGDYGDSDITFANV